MGEDSNGVILIFVHADFVEREIRALLALRLETTMRYLFLRRRKTGNLWAHVSFCMALLPDPIYRSSSSLSAKFASLLSTWRVSQLPALCMSPALFRLTMGYFGDL